MSLADAAAVAVRFIYFDTASQSFKYSCFIVAKSIWYVFNTGTKNSS